jgi:predicted amidophosphoribosyltransferase
LSINSNALEHYMLHGYSVAAAVDRVYAENRPTCAVCGKPIKHASKSAVFCRRTPECRRYSRRYVYLYSRRGHTKVEALGIVLSELGSD